MDTVSIVSDKGAGYYGARMWGYFRLVREEQNRRISGDPNCSWIEHFYRSQAQRTFKNALILNCGNGRIEREILATVPLFESAVGVDFSTTLIRQARDLAGDLPLRYVELDTNTAQFPNESFDLVINFAAGHHIAYIDRVFRRICELLPSDGCFVNYDYVGPHRNQYPFADWQAIWEVNQGLPEEARRDLVYPHLPTMLVDDPTEAIHSELILESLHRYFHIDEQKHIGGGIAYTVLSENPGLMSLAQTTSDVYVQRVLDLDADYISNGGQSYFDYIVARPNKKALLDPDALHRFTEDENNRELRAQAQGGEYYPRTMLQALTEDLSDARIAVQHKQAYIEEHLHSGEVTSHQELKKQIQLMRQKLNQLCNQLEQDRARHATRHRLSQYLPTGLRQLLKRLRAMALQKFAKP